MTTVVVLSDCPPKLRGDMTKWFVEINTGVYVGNIGARVRDEVWERIVENIGRGHATMVYGATGEQRMDFRVHNAYWEPVDFDGLKLMRRPERREPGSSSCLPKPGFSSASAYRMASRGKSGAKTAAGFCTETYVVLDLETTGLDAACDEIIEIGAILVERGEVVEKLQTLVRCREPLSRTVTELTGITDSVLLASGVSLLNAVHDLRVFAEDIPFVCHNAAFEQSFLAAACKSIGVEPFENRFIDTLKMSRLLLPNMGDYKLSTLAERLGVQCATLHRAPEDCEVTYRIYTKLKEIASVDTQKSE